MKMISMITALALFGAAKGSYDDERTTAFIDLDGLQNGQGMLEVDDNTDVTVVVKENRSTGYSWQITKNDCGSKFELMDDEYVKHPNRSAMNKSNRRSLAGAPGQHKWVFATPGPDSNHIRGLPCTLNFEYTRPWEKDVAPAKTKELTVVVGKNEY